MVPFIGCRKGTYYLGLSETIEERDFFGSDSRLAIFGKEHDKSRKQIDFRYQIKEMRPL
jgi:hypothetical protein